MAVRKRRSAAKADSGAQAGAGASAKPKPSKGAKQAARRKAPAGKAYRCLTNVRANGRDYPVGGTVVLNDDQARPIMAHLKLLAEEEAEATEAMKQAEAVAQKAKADREAAEG